MHYKNARNINDALPTEGDVYARLKSYGGQVCVPHCAVSCTILRYLMTFLPDDVVVWGFLSTPLPALLTRGLFCGQ